MKAIIIALALLMAALVFCGDNGPTKAADVRFVRVTFVNHTRDVRTLYVTTPDGRNVVGAFSQGGKLSVSLSIYDPSMPFDVSWEAGNLAGSFTITPDMPDYLKVVLTSRGAIGPNTAGG
ncbi:MAG: hypothetical protein EHM48_08930 [Planctomycetaceae bacterium]|nr:MAG: hypothetical protein EHM48_08930 [Planctomycetaceae bacterium]